MSPRAVWGMVAVALLGVGATLAFKEASATRSQPPPVYGAVPVFSLVDHEGRDVSDAALRGSVWIADFIFTRCAGQCPMMNKQMATLAASFPPAEPIQFLSFTVDPSWDTASVLQTYARHVDGFDPRWRFVTGSAEALTRLCVDGFHLAFAGEGGTPEEPITHSTRLVLVDARGAIRGYYDAAEAAQMARLRQDAQRVLAETSAAR